ncbi:MAG TPA: PAS domain-containing protein [Reyranella sp.]|nr:PAS domain-containing protein [Reyranella sp.]
MAPSTLAAMVASKPCKDLADYWTSLRRSDPLPRRAQVDPGAIKPLLPYLYLYLVEARDSGCIVIRLAGTALRQLYGIEMTGHDMVALGAPEHQTTRRWRYLRAAGQPCGIWFLRHQRYGTGAMDEVEHIFLPLIVDGAGPALPARQFIGIAASKSGCRWIAGPENERLMTPHAFRFLDIGFGTLETIEPPALSQQSSLVTAG